LAANLYYAQPLIADIGAEIGISPELSGLVVSVTQIGYGLGLFLLVSLADLIENRRLLLVTLTCTAAGLLGAAISTAGTPFFVASFVVGLCSTGAQVLIPFAAHLAPADKRGRMVGNVMAGLLTGIMLARPISLFIAASFGWRAVFWISAALMMAIAIALAKFMPRYKADSHLRYRNILLSMAGILKHMPILRWRATYQALMFAAFNMFWTAVPMMLAERFGMDEHAIGLFALAGAGGALVAPIAGRLADRGHTRAASAGAMILLGLGFFATNWAASAGAVWILVLFTILIDAGVQANQVVSQRIIFSVPAEVRGRVNAIYMTIIFAGGAAGSLSGSLTYHWGGWSVTAVAGGLVGACALLLFGVQQYISPSR
jgi:predicted MFS family arabinose efflux permease